MSWAEELKAAMSLLAEHPQTIFIGQSVAYPGHLLYSTLEHIPRERRLELPVIEDAQVGISIGLALSGWLPVSIFPRMDFLIIAANQLVNHLDKFEEMTNGQVRPHVIIRTMVGSTIPLYPGPQHCQDHTMALRMLMPNTTVMKLTRPEDVVPAYQRALERPGPWVLIEAPPKRRGYES
jgi:pyruvate dehydrogenase E1 component beta subunit